jgi:hypothetical protein
MTTTYGIFSYLLRWCHFHFQSLRVIFLTESCRIVFGTKYVRYTRIGIESITFTLIFNKLIQEGEILEIQ